jgi:hypothetical protein
MQFHHDEPKSEGGAGRDFPWVLEGCCRFDEETHIQVVRFCTIPNIPKRRRQKTHKHRGQSSKKGKVSVAQWSIRFLESNK